MASVYYLIDDALHVADDLVEQYTQEDKTSKNLHRAATIIQRTYREYVAQKQHQDLVQAVVTLQKYTRGWLVRYHLPDYMAEFYDQICKKNYQKSAVVIQSFWRGFQARKEVNVKEILKEQREIQEKLAASMEEDKTLQGSQHQEPEADKALKRFILEIIFDRHHLLSTKTKKGVLTANKQLRNMEEILKTLPWKTYTNKLRNLYQRYKKKQEPQYLFQDRKMRKWEDLTRLRDKSQDLKDMKTVTDTSRKVFKLTPKLDEPNYERQINLQGAYVKRQLNITRTEDKSLNVGEKDFVLAVKEIIKEIPTSYWDLLGQDCWEHFLP